MSKELKPCPFCGETVSLDYSELPNKKHWYITCDCCGMMYQAVVCQRKDTKTGWNNRPIEDALNTRIAELEDWAYNIFETNNGKDSPNDTQTQTIVYGKEREG